MSLLVDGLIPKNTECPFLNKCTIKKASRCLHMGKDHSTDFSCASARSFDRIDLLPEQVEGVNVRKFGENQVFDSESKFAANVSVSFVSNNLPNKDDVLLFIRQGDEAVLLSPKMI